MHVLVATNFSSSAECALCRALSILSNLGGRLTITHIVQSNQSDASISDERAVSSRLLKELARTCQDTIGIETDWLLEVDDACAGILAAADAAGVDLIVMGSATSRATDVFGGNIVEKIARRSIRPVLVSAEATTLPHSNVLLALDFDEASKVAARDALSMGMLDEANVTVMHAFDTPVAGMLKRAFVPGDEVERYILQKNKRQR